VKSRRTVILERWNSSLASPLRSGKSGPSVPRHSASFDPPAHALVLLTLAVHDLARQTEGMKMFLSAHEAVDVGR